MDSLAGLANTVTVMQSSGPDHLSMTRRDPILNMARFYAIVLQPTLFGEVSIIRNWGRIGTKGQAMVETFATETSAERQAAIIERQKRRRGYI